MKSIFLFFLYAISVSFIGTPSMAEIDWSDDLDKAADAARAGDYATALKIYSAGCDQGNQNACLGLGTLYFKGWGVPQDSVRGEKLLTNACDAGVAMACRNLAVAFSAGTAVPKDYARAAVLHAKGCESGDVPACYDLGVLYREGWGVKQDYARAAALFTKACDGGDSWGCTNLGIFHDKGIGVPHSWTTALELFDKACDGGDPSGCTNLAQKLIQDDVLDEPGEALTRNRGKIATLVRRALAMNPKFAPALDMAQRIGLK